MNAYHYFADLGKEIEPPTDGILTRTLHQDERLKVVLFGFSAGQELSEHTAASPAIMHFVRGEADVTLGAEKMAAGANSWFHMPPQMPHSVVARAPVVMLLLLLKSPQGA